MNKLPTFSKSIKIVDNKYISIYIHSMNPGGVEMCHYHDAIEIEYVLSGNCITHKKGRLYIRKKGELHEGINDSNQKLVFIDITIPAENSDNTHYIK